MAADQAAPLILWAWTRQLTEGIFADEVGAAAVERVSAPQLSRRARRRAGARRRLVVRRQDARPRSRPARSRSTPRSTRALDELQAAQGGDVGAWRWGGAHVARSEHRPFSRVKALARWFELRTPVGGDTYTVNVSRVGLRPDPTTGELYLDEHGPSLRALYDLGDPARSRVMQSTGQSGIVFSPLYRDFVEPWARVDYVPLWSAPAVVDAGAARHALTRLAPARQPCETQTRQTCAEQRLALAPCRPTRARPGAAHEIGRGHEGVEHARVLALAGDAAQSCW